MVTEISGPELKKLIGKPRHIILVDARAPEDYAVDHLPGALSLLNADVENRAEALLPRPARIVVYSNDERCPASGLVAEKLHRMGFGEIYDYKGSYADWRARGYPLESD